MIVKALANLIEKEHSYRPITGRVLTLGKQIVRVAGFWSRFDIELVSIDIKDADIIHNLNYPVSKFLYEKFDFIIDGGTFDHLFDLRQAFENIVRMLKPDGRVLHQNAASNYTGATYLSFSPEIFYDYYTINWFADCKVWLAELDRIQGDEWDLYEFEAVKDITHFISPRLQMVVVIAEKGEYSTWDKMPIQYQYRELTWSPVSKRNYLPKTKGGMKGFNYVGKI